MSPLAESGAARTVSELCVLYELKYRRVAGARPEETSRHAARRTRELLDADGCGILLVDVVRGEFYFRAASQRDGSQWRFGAIHFPVERGVAGWVLEHDRPVLVERTSTDPRFYDGVDGATGVQTRNLLCAPLRTASGTVGVLEIVNLGRPATHEDLRFAERVAAEIAAGYGEALDNLSFVATISGFAGALLLLLGIGCGLVAVVAHLAWALPARELPRWRSLLPGALLSLTGGFLVGLAGRAARRVAAFAGRSCREKRDRRRSVASRPGLGY